MENEQQTSYLQSAFIVSAVIALIATIVSLIISYRFIGSEPTGSLFSPMTYMGIVVCLIMAFTGLVTVWHYIKETNVALKPGRGAVIGMVAGIIVALFSSIYGQLWNIIDPSYLDRLIEAMIANAEAIENIPDETRQVMIDAMYQQGEEMKSAWGIVKGFLINGALSMILNALTGILGVSLFSKKPEEGL